jgi:hypothetical protein
MPGNISGSETIDATLKSELSPLVLVVEDIDDESMDSYPLLASSIDSMLSPNSPIIFISASTEGGNLYRNVIGKSDRHGLSPSPSLSTIKSDISESKNAYVCDRAAAELSQIIVKVLNPRSEIRPVSRLAFENSALPASTIRCPDSSRISLSNQRGIKRALVKFENYGIQVIN